MKLIVYYVLFMILGDFLAYLIGYAVESRWPEPIVSLSVFVFFYMAFLWVAWIFAVRLTEPKAEPTQAAGATQIPVDEARQSPA